MRRSSLGLVLLLAASGCSGRPPGEAASGDRPPPVQPAVDAATEGSSTVAEGGEDEQSTQVVAVVVGYIPGLLHYDYADGYSESHDGTELTILSPERLAGRPLFIYHNQPITDEGSPWKKAGARVRFSLPADNLEPPEGTSFDIFSSGVILEEVK
jgi:hypothetical protein